VTRKKRGRLLQDIVIRARVREAADDLSHELHVRAPVEDAAFRDCRVPGEEIDQAGRCRHANVPFSLIWPDRKRSQVLRLADPRTAIGRNRHADFDYVGSADAEHLVAGEAVLASRLDEQPARRLRSIEAGKILKREKPPARGRDVALSLRRSFERRACLNPVAHLDRRPRRPDLDLPVVAEQLVRRRRYVGDRALDGLRAHLDEERRPLRPGAYPHYEIAAVALHLTPYPAGGRTRAAFMFSLLQSSRAAPPDRREKFAAPNADCGASASRMFGSRPSSFVRSAARAGYA
jgi:hypothetical protein